jgi:hypothetical protein
MKKHLPLAFLIFIAVFLFSGCSDKVEITRTYTIYEPVFMSLQELRSAVDVIGPVEIDLTGKIYLYKNYLLLNDPGKGIHIINNQNPAKPSVIKFINIPGNFDMAVKGDILYADSYMDLVAIDIGNINNISVIDRLENIFLHSFTYHLDQEKGIIVDWVETEKIVVSEDEFGYYPHYFWYKGGSFLAVDGFRTMETAFMAPSTSTGVGGSMARFTIVNNFLYTVDYSQLYAFNISNLKQPIKESVTSIGWGIETIFPYGKHLFIGSETGMIIYDISAPATPKYLSNFAHVRSCDPVVVQDTLAYVTLRGGNECGGFTNQLDVINIKDLGNPRLIKSYSMTGPYGLGIDKTTLFVCDGVAGLKVYNASDVHNIDKNMIKTYSNIDAYDVIPFNNLLIMIGKDGLHQFDYSNPANIVFLSKLDVKAGNKK